MIMADQYTLPMPTRSTDVRQIHHCPGGWLLSKFCQQTPASFFLLGSQVHSTVERSILNDLDLDQALAHARAGIDRQLAQLIPGQLVVESSKRGFASMHDDAVGLITNWFRFVHPNSPDRLEIYNSYEWKPQTEVPFLRSAESAGTKYPVWGIVDALFAAKDGSHHAVVDWKSSVSIQDSDYQLGHYRFGLNLPTARAWYHNLDKTRAGAVIQEAHDYPGDPAVRQRIVATEAVKEGILEDRRVPFIPSSLCSYCPSQQACPVRGTRATREANLDALRRMLHLATPMEVEVA